MTAYDKLEEYPEDDTTEDSESIQDVILKIPEENITLNDGADIYHYDIHFESTMTDGSEKVTSIDIEGVTTNNSKFFQKGHRVILSVRFKNLMVDITTAVIDEVTEDNDGIHLLVTEQLPKPSPVKDERSAELKHEGINSDPNHTKEHNQHRPWEQAIREDIMARGEDPDDYVIQRSRNTPKCPKGEPGVEGMKTTIKVGNGNSSIVSDGDTITLKGDKITLNGEEVPKVDHLVLKGVKITLGDITLNADELVFDGHINLNEANKV